jgi:hypothetical protein
MDNQQSLQLEEGTVILQTVKLLIFVSVQNKKDEKTKEENH